MIFTSGGPGGQEPSFRASDNDRPTARSKECMNLNMSDTFACPSFDDKMRLGFCGGHLTKTSLGAACLLDDWAYMGRSSFDLDWSRSRNPKNVTAAAKIKAGSLHVRESLRSHSRTPFPLEKVRNAPLWPIMLDDSICEAVAAVANCCRTCVGMLCASLGWCVCAGLMFSSCLCCMLTAPTQSGCQECRVTLEAVAAAAASHECTHTQVTQTAGVDYNRTRQEDKLLSHQPCLHDTSVTRGEIGGQCTVLLWLSDTGNFLAIDAASLSQQSTLVNSLLIEGINDCIRSSSWIALRGE